MQMLQPSNGLTGSHSAKTVVSTDINWIMICFIDVIFDNIQDNMAEILESHPLVEIEFILGLSLSGSSIIDHE